MSRDLRRTRKCGSKSRNGCITCKERRVKCGEERPNCIRCLTFGIDCKGYYKSASVRSTGLEPLKTYHRPLVPKATSLTRGPSVEDIKTQGGLILHRSNAFIVRTEAKTLRSSSSVTGLAKTSYAAQSGETISLEKCRNHSIIPAPFISRFKTQEEHNFYRFFSTEVVDTLAASSPSIIWNQMILQAAEAEPYILDAVLAVSAIHKIIVSAPDTRTPDALREFKDEHYFALQKYHRSLVSMRTAIADGKMDARTALIACLLTVCFENAYGRRDLAIANCLAGSKLKRQLAITCSDYGSPPRELKGKLVQSDPVEVELVYLFVRLDISSMVFVDSRSVDEHQAIKYELDNGTEAIPSRFSTLSEAASYCNVIMSLCWHFMKILGVAEHNIHYRHGRKKNFNFPDYSYGWNPLIGTLAKVPKQVLQEADSFTSKLKRWFTAFEPIWDTFSAKPFSDDYFRALLLCFEAKVTLVSIQGSLYTQETEWDKHLPEFQEIVSLAEIFLAARWKPAYMSFDSETILNLTYVSWKCRDGAVRRRILKLMEDYPRREFVYDSIYSVVNIHWLIEMEEGDKCVAKCHQIAEEDRFRICGLEFDADNGTASIWGWRRVNGHWEYLSVACSETMPA